MEKHSENLHPLAERTSSTDNTSTLAAWDFATLALMKAEPTLSTNNASLMSPGRVERCRALNHQSYYWHETCALTGDDQLVITPTDRLAASLPGRWLAKPMSVIDLALPFTFATADGATLYTVPTGCYLRVVRGYWEITTACTGGSSSAIGLASDQTPHNTAGDLLGGSGGDVEATLVVGDYIEGTVGADQAAGIILKPGKLVTFERITSVFTAGAGNAHLICEVLANAGA